jgi:hypothetical protein
VKRERVTGRELTPEEKRAITCTVELTLEDVEYLADAVNSHKLLHERLVKLSNEPVPWEGHLEMLRIGYEGERRANLTKANLDALAYKIRGEDGVEWAKSLTSSNE